MIQDLSCPWYTALKSMTKLNFRLKSFSFSSSTTTASPIAVVDGGPAEPKKPQRTPKQYLVNLRDNRFFTLRKRRSEEGGLQVDRISSPKSLPGRSRITSPKTPQIAALFSSQAVRSESNRHHRQYAVSLSNFPQIKNLMTVDPESPSISRLRRLNSQKQRVASAPMNLGVVSTGSGEDVRGSVTLVDQGTISSVSHSIVPIPSLILQTPTSGSGGPRESGSSAGVDPKEIAAIAERPPTAKKSSGLHRSVGLLQEAAKSIRAQEEYSQSSLFWILVFPAIILASMATLALAPEAIWKSTLFGMNNSLSIPCVVGVGVAACLRWVLSIMASMFDSFCEMDVDLLFRKSGIVDQGGSRVAQADIVTGVFG